MVPFPATLLFGRCSCGYFLCGAQVPSCVRLPMEAINSSSSMPSVFTFLLPMLIAV